MRTYLLTYVYFILRCKYLGIWQDIFSGVIEIGLRKAQFTVKPLKTKLPMRNNHKKMLMQKPNYLGTILRNYKTSSELYFQRKHIDLNLCIFSEIYIFLYLFLKYVLNWLPRTSTVFKKL